MAITIIIISSISIIIIIIIIILTARVGENWTSKKQVGNVSWHARVDNVLCLKIMLFSR